MSDKKQNQQHTNGKAIEPMTPMAPVSEPAMVGPSTIDEVVREARALCQDVLDEKDDEGNRINSDINVSLEGFSVESVLYYVQRGFRTQILQVRSQNVQRAKKALAKGAAAKKAVTSGRLSMRV